MKKSLPLAAAVLGLAALPQARALDITVSDPHNDKSFGGANLGPDGPENNTVQYNAVANQTWDLERFDLTGSTLSVTGGFNFLTGMGTGSSGTFPMGDIFVYLGSEVPYSIPGNNLSDLNGPWSGRDDWNYVIHFDRGTSNNLRDTPGNGIGYTILAKGNQTVNYTQGPNALITGLPWYVSEGFQPSSYASLTSAVDGEGTHYTLGGIDLTSILGLGQSFYLHTTMRCGNDVLWGYNEGTSRVPDGGAGLCLLGLGIGAVGVLRRRLN